MALFNHATKEVTAKLVYYGPGLCGKTTNLQWVHEHLQFKSKGKLVSLATQTDRTLFFDFLPVELGTIRGMRTRMQIYTVPGQVFYEATRRMVLKGCDAVVFVADSQAAMLDANFESLQSLRRNLLANEIDPAVPMVIQYNKRDLPTALPVSVLNARLNARNLPFFEAVAFKGTGVEETLRGVTRILFKSLSEFYGDADASLPEVAEAPDTPATPPAPPSRAIKIQVPDPRSAERMSPASARPASATPVAKAAPSAPPTSGASATATRPPAPTPGAAPIRPAPAHPAAAAPKPAVPTPARPAPPAPVAKSTPPATAVPATAPAATAPRGAAPTTSPTPTVRAEPSARPPDPPAVPARPAPPSPPDTPVAPAEVETVLLDDDDIEVELEAEEPPATIVIRSSQPAPARPVAATPQAPAPTPAPPAPAVPAQPARPTATASPAAPAPEPPRPAAPLPRAVERPAAAAVFRESAPAAPAEAPPRGEGLRSDQWLYMLEGAQRGPIDVEDLVDLVLTSIPEDTKVWHPGLEGWVRANQVRDIAEEIPPPLPIPGAARGAYVDEDMPDFNTVPTQFRTALIADEDEAFRKYLAMPLAAQGFNVFEAADGAAAWLLAVQNRPWLILADVSMPEVDGFEFCRRVRSHPLLSHTPLLFISGSDKYKERYRALQIGADDFLSKQMPIRELLMRIQLLLTKYSDLGDQKDAGVAEAAGAFQGRIEVFGAPALLQMCAQGGLSGILTAFAEDEANTAAVMGFRSGDIITATVGTTSGPEAVYAYLTWEKGSFKFTPGDPGQGEPLAQSVEHLLLEGCRLLDESQRGGEGSEAPL